MRYPKFLTKGDKISFVATSFGATTKPYSTRVKYAKRTFECFEKRKNFNIKRTKT